MITTAGRQFEDWTQNYRIFSESRFETQIQFDIIRNEILDMIPEDSPIVVAMDDTIVKKNGTKIPGVKYYRDPLSPPFHPNFIRGQRFIQLSAAIIPEDDGPARLIPIDFVHAPVPKKPPKSAAEEEFENYKKLQKQMRLSKIGSDRINILRKKLDEDEANSQQSLWMVVDGSYTNKEVLRNKPDNTVIIGRIRKDAAFHFPVTCEERKQFGRIRKYGKKAPTPEDLRKDMTKEWQPIEVFASGKKHSIDIKTMTPVLSRVIGHETPVRVIVIRPLSYRPRKGAKLLYRKPAFLICTDPEIPVAQIVQAYIWRWEIEVNFRDEKQLIGLGEAQVRSQNSVEQVPSFTVANYGMLLLAAIKAFGINDFKPKIPSPAWRKGEKLRASSGDIISHLRYELWGEALNGANFSSFVSQKRLNTKPEKFNTKPAEAVLYAVN